MICQMGSKSTTMLRQNSELRPHRIWNWTIPAWYVQRENGSRFMTCPSAGICAQFCYARHGTYMFRNVLAAHERNLNRVLNDTVKWESDMVEELLHKRFRPTGIPRDIPNLSMADLDDWTSEWLDSGGAAVRVHDSGDFFASWYMSAWIRIARAVSDVLFYAYTKEVTMTRELRSTFPPNFRIVFSTGGLQDQLIDPDDDRHADVFPDEAEVIKAGYTSQDASDLLAVLAPSKRIGIPANNIRHFNRRLAGRRFAEVVPPRLRMRMETNEEVANRRI